MAIGFFQQNFIGCDNIVYVDKISLLFTWRQLNFRYVRQKLPENMDDEF
ncbi:hypothetical protein CFter6_1069 [Collimonas fungivorans]|uniref:Uncharacterized protein n=1 Tax=Collimonas fungivorans TaxID=158899 RepID=A0A127P7Q5_9BURK|nr:hypothetical protein CFter6_1069 [Collimonas fungivorans]